MEAILLVDHGSRRAEANDQLECIAALVAERVPAGVLVAWAHMELAPPDLEEAVRSVVARGASSVVVVPYFLTPGRHALEDIPRLAGAASARHGVPVRIAPPLGVHPLLADLVITRAGLGSVGHQARVGQPERDFG